MANGKHFKRGAPGDSGGHNPINSRMPEEYICVVGSCSNTYNGYMYLGIDIKSGKPAWVPCPDPKNVAGVPAYISGPHGTKATTHDIYWANFLDPAIRLYANKLVQPKPGDVVTIMVFITGYLKRQSVDWDASPFNRQLHPQYDDAGNLPSRRSAPNPASSSRPQITSLDPGSRTAGGGGFSLTVNGSGFQTWAKVTWDGTTLSTSFVSASLLTALVPASAISRRGTARVQVVVGLAESYEEPFLINPSALDTDSEEVINNEILMRKSGLNSEGVIRRSRTADEEIEYIHNIPRRIVHGHSLWGTPQLPDVLVKLLVFNDPSDLSKYLLTGSSSASYWQNSAVPSNEDEMGIISVSDEGSYFDAELVPSSRPWTARWKKLLKSAGTQPPSINRSKVKIKRFDYVGHSDKDAFFLQYGWENAKGVLPTDDVRFETRELTAALPRKNLTRDATAYLWGCHQGGGMAPELAKAFQEVTACEGSTFFNRIFESRDAMPVPQDGSGWKTYKRP